MTSTIQPSEHKVTLRDGTALFYRAWLPSTATDKALILFHRGHEHSGRWQETVEALALDDVAIFAWDARGHGHSPGERGAARLQLEGENHPIELKPGDFLNIPAHKRHRVEWTTPDKPTIWLAIHYRGVKGTT